jgi:hypothetical protein
MRISYRKICKEHNHNPWKLLIYGFAPLPYWAANSLALRKISGAPMPSWLGESGEQLFHFCRIMPPFNIAVIYYPALIKVELCLRTDLGLYRIYFSSIV